MTPADTKTQVFVYLDGQRLAAEWDATGPLVFVRLPGSAVEVSVHDADDEVGPVAIRHSTSFEPAQDLPVALIRVDGAVVYEVLAPEGQLLFPARIVPQIPQDSTRPGVVKAMVARA